MQDDLAPLRPFLPLAAFLALAPSSSAAPARQLMLGRPPGGLPCPAMPWEPSPVKVRMMPSMPNLAT